MPQEAGTKEVSLEASPQMSSRFARQEVPQKLTYRWPQHLTFYQSRDLTYYQAWDLPYYLPQYLTYQ